MRVVLTGAEGFLGWHLRCRFKAIGGYDIVPVGRSSFRELQTLAEGADAIVHVAGINRAPDESSVAEGNIALAEAVAAVVQKSSRPPRVVYANSIQAEGDSSYGRGKRVAADILRLTAKQTGTELVDVVLPNIFGEHGKPRYNSFVATFADVIANGGEVSVQDNRVELLHAQDAAAAVIAGLDGDGRTDYPAGDPRGVREVADTLHRFSDVYQRGEIPQFADRFELNLFNTFRAAAFPNYGVTPFKKHTDPRGSLVETMKSHGSGGQVFFSTTVPGVTRGEHFHLHKIERFVVISGQARIQLRRLFTTDVINFDVTGDQPVAIDMPTNWVHNVTNTGDNELLTLFWTDKVFDPAAPDTYPQPVEKDMEVAR